MAKKILIAYATAGSGHRKAAEAIAHTAAARGHKVEIADIVASMAWLSRKIYSDGYLFLISQCTPVWGLVYGLSDTPCLRIFNVHLRRFIDGWMGRHFIRRLLRERPDVVISTQFLASELVTIAKIKHGLKTRLVTVVTDFGVHNFWVNDFVEPNNLIRVRFEVSDDGASSTVEAAIDAFAVVDYECRTFICGDIDGSEAIDIDDIVFLIDYIFGGGAAPDPVDAADVECSGGADIDDVVYLIAYVFTGGPEPCLGC